MTTEIEPHILKKFEIKKRIGKGAYGIVWKALNKKTKEIIALKKIFDAFRNQTDAQRTFREIAFLQNFGNHPNIVRLYNVIRASSDKDIYLVFEFMETDLHNVIKKGNILNDVHKQYIMYQLLKATAYLHSGEVIHRDQKPSNVLLDSYCSVKLCDFGLARSLKGRNKSETGSKVNCKTLLPALTEYVATRWYRAPEILLACHDYTKGVDIWSLGCILGEMLIGTPLFPGTSTLDQIERIMAGLPKPSAEDLASVKSPYSASILQKARIRNRRSLDQMLANVDKTATDLLYKMLHFNPYKRITALEALKHPYVRRFYCPSEIMIMSHHVTPPLDDNVQLTVSEYRDRLYQMISSKRPETMTVQQNEIQKSELIKTKQDVASIPSSMPKLKCQTAVKRFSVTLYPQNAVIKKQQPTSLSPTSPPLQPVKLKQQQLKDTNGHSTPYENEEACVQVNLKQRKHENRLKNSPDKLSSSKAKIPLGMNHSSPTSTTTATRTTSTSTAAIRATCNGGNNHSDTPITKASPQALHNHRVCKYDNTSECMTEYDKCNNISRSALNSTTPLQQYSRQQYPQPQHLADQQSRSALNSRMTYTNSPLISHNSISRSNSVNKLPMEHKTSKRYSAVSPSQYCSQYITKVSVQNSSTLSGNKLSDYSDQYNSSNSSNTCENNHAGAHQSQQNNTNNVSSASYIPPSNSRITTSNYYYFTAATTADRCSNSYSHQNIQFEDGMVTPKADNNKEDRPGNEDHHLLSQAENSLLLRDNDYLASSNDTYEENTNYLCNINHNLLHNQKYCSTSNIQNDVNNTSHHIMNTKTSNGAKDLTPKVSSLSTLEITQKVTPSVYSMPYEKNDVISKSNCQSIGHTRLEEKYISRNNTTTKNHSNSNNNHKGSVVNYSNALRIDDTVRYKTASLIQRKIDSCKLNGKYNNQSDHEPILSTVSTNQKLKLIQGSTDVQNSMFQSKISDSLNNLNSKLLKNGHHHQKQQLGEGNPHTQQSGHSSNQNGSKFTEGNHHHHEISSTSNLQNGNVTHQWNNSDINLSQKLIAHSSSPLSSLKHHTSVSSPVLNHHTPVPLQIHQNPHDELATINSSTMSKCSLISMVPSNGNNNSSNNQDKYTRRYSMNCNNSNSHNNIHNGMSSISHSEQRLQSNQPVHNRFNSLSAISNHKSRLPRFNYEGSSNALLTVNSTVRKGHINKTEDDNNKEDLMIFRSASTTDFMDNHQVSTNSYIQLAGATTLSKPIKLDSTKISHFVDNYQNTHLPQPNYVYNQSIGNGKLMKHYSPLPATNCQQTSTIPNDILPASINPSHLNTAHSNSPIVNIIKKHKVSNGSVDPVRLRAMLSTKSAYSRK